MKICAKMILTFCSQWRWAFHIKFAPKLLFPASYLHQIWSFYGFVISD